MLLINRMLLSGITLLAITWCVGCGDDAKRLEKSSPDHPIVFASTYDESHGEIYLITAPGNPPIRLTNDTEANFHPVLSPDGMKVAYVTRGSDLRENIWVMLVDEAGAVIASYPLTNDACNNITPCWSPDGTKVLFARINDDPLTDLPAGIYEQAITSDTAALVVGDNARNPAYSPTHPEMLAFSRVADGVEQVYTALRSSPDTVTQVTTLTDPALVMNTIAWSPDGRQLACSGIAGNGNGRIYLVPPTGGAATLLTSTDDDSGGPSWFDATTIVFFANAGDDGAHNLYAIPATGGTPTVVLSNFGDITRAHIR